MIVSGTGTWRGMSSAQHMVVTKLMHSFKLVGIEGVHDGMCIGFDEQFHSIAVEMGLLTYGHPGVNKWGKPYRRTQKTDYTLILPEKPFLERNDDMVLIGDVIVAVPAQVREQFIGSGTWATIRRAKKAKKPLVIVYPYGATDCSPEYLTYFAKWSN